MASTWYCMHSKINSLQLVDSTALVLNQLIDYTVVSEDTCTQNEERA